MVSQSDIDRLRLEADTIMTRYQQVQEALERARTEEGDHWEAGELDVTLETPTGESIDLTLELDASPAENAQVRYDRAAELEATLERRQRVVDQVAQLPADPVAYLLCYHLDTVGGNYPRSMAGYLDADRDRIEELCERLEAEGLLERVESGTIKQRKAKAKQTNEVRQHHTYYRLSRAGDHLLRFLEEREGKLNVLRHLPEGQRILNRLVRDGPDDPRSVAAELALDFESARHHCRALQRVGLVTESGTDHPAYAPTGVAGTVLTEME